MIYVTNQHNNLKLTRKSSNKMKQINGKKTLTNVFDSHERNEVRRRAMNTFPVRMTVTSEFENNETYTKLTQMKVSGCIIHSMG